MKVGSELVDRPHCINTNRFGPRVVYPEGEKVMTFICVERYGTIEIDRWYTDEHGRRLQNCFETACGTWNDITKSTITPEWRCPECGEKLEKRLYKKKQDKEYIEAFEHKRIHSFAVHLREVRPDWRARKGRPSKTKKSKRGQSIIVCRPFPLKVSSFRFEINRLAIAFNLEVDKIHRTLDNRERLRVTFIDINPLPLEVLLDA